MNTNVNYIVNEIKKNGYYIIKNYYSDDFCQSILKDVNKNKYIKQKGEGNDSRVIFFQKYSKNANFFLKDNFLLEIGTNVVGKKIDVKKRCQLGIVNYNRNIETSSGGGWHVDNHNSQFKALLYLTNVTENNGPFAIINPPLKSNEYKSFVGRNNTRFPNTIENDYKNNIDILTGNIGDVILVNTSNIHRGMTIKEGKRITLTNYYYDS